MYVDTIDVVPSNFSSAERYSYSAPRRDAALNRSTVFVFRDATASPPATAHLAPFSDIRIVIRAAATGRKVLHKSSRASARIMIRELANCLHVSSSLPAANMLLHTIDLISFANLQISLMESPFVVFLRHSRNSRALSHCRKQ